MPGKYLGFDAKDYSIPNLLSFCTVPKGVSGNRLNLFAIVTVYDVEHEVTMPHTVLGWLHLPERSELFLVLPVRNFAILMRTWWRNCLIRVRCWEEPALLVFGSTDSKNRSEKSLLVSLENFENQVADTCDHALNQRKNYFTCLCENFKF